MSATKRLYRKSSAGRLAGVCAGIADYLDADVTLVRLAWVLLAIFPGGIVGGILGYLAAWIIMPDSTEAGAAPGGVRRLTRSTTDRKVAGVCGGLAEYFATDATVVRLIWAILTVVPGCIVLGVAGYLMAWLIMPLPASTTPVVASSAA